MYLLWQKSILITKQRYAFNSLRWEDIIKALQERFRVPIYIFRILRSYLKDRKLFYDISDGRRDVVITSGAVKGSIPGPDLWNLSFDVILGIEMPERNADIASVISARDIEDVRRKLNQVMIRTQMWLKDHGPELAKNKTEVILMTMTHIPHEMSIYMICHWSQKRQLNIWG